MEARLLSLFVATAALLSMGAGYRTQNFIVSAPTPQLAAEIGQAAEQFRTQLAIEWLGRELPPWPQVCPIEAQVAPHLGAGGATSFVFIQGQPRDWTMTIQGSRERVLDSVLPHEITHTIFATHYGRPLPRWADEGACTTVEHSSEKTKQDQNLIVFLKSNRGIAFNKMFAMREYPKDILPLYSQGFSLARFLIQQGGKRKYVDYVGEGMQSNDWNGVTRKYYGFKDLSELQITWLDWVKQGSPHSLDPAAPEPGSPDTQVASARPNRNVIPAQDASMNGERSALAPVSVSQPAARAQFAGHDRQESANATGWYGKIKNDSRQTGPMNMFAQDSGPAADSPIANAPPARPLPNNSLPLESRESVSRPPNPEPARQVILEWSRHPSDKVNR